MEWGTMVGFDLMQPQIGWFVHEKEEVLGPVYN